MDNKDKRIALLEAMLAECLDYLQNEYDVKDGDDGEQLPNEAMQLGLEVDETLNGRNHR